MKEVQIGLGKAAATLAGSFDAGGRTPDLNLKLGGARMPIGNSGVSPGARRDPPQGGDPGGGRSTRK